MTPPTTAREAGKAGRHSAAAKARETGAEAGEPFRHRATAHAGQARRHLAGRGRGLGLHDGLLEQLGVVRGAGHEQALGGEVDRTQLDVGFEEEAVGADRDHASDDLLDLADGNGGSIRDS